MATAIVRSYSEEGFIIAADGREAVVDTGEIKADNRQKVFQIGQSPAAYCLTGAIHLGHTNEAVLDTVLFDFLAEIRRRVAEQPLDGFQTLKEWGSVVFTRVFESLQNACECGKVDLPTKLGRIGSRYKILTVYLDGYVCGNPESVDIRFSHQGRVPFKPEVSSYEPSSWYMGSDAVGNAIIGNSAAFARYKGDIPPRSIQVSPMLNRSIQTALRYMECCMSPEGTALDPRWCRTIGGRIHIAKITPKVGFRWVTGFEPD
jgi:hypothetical protein